MDTQSLLGVRISVGTKDELLQAARSLVGVGGRVYTVNPLMLVEASRDVAMREVLNRATLCIPDGVGVRRTFLARGVYTDVLCGVDLGAELLAAGGSVGFVGGAPGVCEEAFARLSRRYPTLSAAFLLDGYTFDEEDVVRRLRATRPSFLYVCLGTPQQERMIDRWAQVSPSTLCMGLGGSFDVYAGRVRRAPSFLRQWGCEWLWRMLCQPRRLRRIPALGRYMYLSMVENRQINCTKKRKRSGKK